MIHLFTNWFNRLLEQRRQWHFENGYGAACVQILVYENPIDYVIESIVNDGGNPAFDDGWRSACYDLKEIMPCQ